MNLNLTEILKQADEFEVLPNGEYIGEVLSYSFETSKTNDKPMIKWCFELENKRRFFFYNMLDNEIGIKLFAQTVRNLNYNGDLDNFDVDQFILNQDLVSHKIIVVLGTQPYQDTMQNYVKGTRKVKEQ